MRENVREILHTFKYLVYSTAVLKISILYWTEIKTVKTQDSTSFKNNTDFSTNITTNRAEIQALN